MSSKIEYCFGNRSTDQCPDYMPGTYVDEAKMTTTKWNGDELVVVFGHDSGIAHDDISDTICEWCHPNVTVVHKKKRQETEIKSPRKFLGIPISKPEAVTKEVYDSTVLYQAHIYENNWNTTNKQYLDDLLRTFAKSHDDKGIMSKIDPEFQPIISKALNAMLHGGLSEALMRRTNAERENQKAREARCHAQQQKKHEAATLANSFVR